MGPRPQAIDRRARPSRSRSAGMAGGAQGIVSCAGATPDREARRPSCRGRTPHLTGKTTAPHADTDRSEGGSDSSERDSDSSEGGSVGSDDHSVTPDDESVSSGDPSVSSGDPSGSSDGDRDVSHVCCSSVNAARRMPAGAQFSFSTTVITRRPNEIPYRPHCGDITPQRRGGTRLGRSMAACRKISSRSTLPTTGKTQWQLPMFLSS